MNEFLYSICTIKCEEEMGSCWEGKAHLLLRILEQIAVLNKLMSRVRMVMYTLRVDYSAKFMSIN